MGARKERRNGSAMSEIKWRDERIWQVWRGLPTAGRRNHAHDPKSWTADIPIPDVTTRRAHRRHRLGLIDSRGQRYGRDGQQVQELQAEVTTGMHKYDAPSGERCGGCRFAPGSEIRTAWPCTMASRDQLATPASIPGWQNMPPHQRYIFEFAMSLGSGGGEILPGMAIFEW